MNREEFLKQFREALEGKVPEQVIDENMRYYRTYIDNQINGGKSEYEVLCELGDPRLLAKTIEESSRFARGRQETQTNYGSGYNNTEYYQNRQGDSKKERHYVRGGATEIPGWIVALIVLIIVVFLITAVFKVFIFFLPAIIAGAAVMLVYKLIKSIFG